MTKRTIPEIRERMHELADDLGCRELHELADETVRTFNGRRGRNESVAVDQEIEEGVRILQAEHPSWTFRRIGAVFNINQGRVSEILSRHPLI